MKKIALLSSFLVAFLISGCASVPKASKEKDAAAKTFSTPTDNQSGIYIYRNSFVGQALKKNVYIDGKLIGESSNKVFFYKQVAPGTHKLSTESEFSDNDLELKTESGKNYFVEQSIKMGAFVGGAKLTAVSEDVGKKEVLKCSLAQ